MGYNRKNTMYTDILLALQRRKEASDIMATEVSSLRLLLHNPVVSKKVVGKSSNSSVDNVNDNGFTNINTLDTNSVETSFLRVELKSGKEIILYKGAWIRTPVGEGQIAQIIPIEDKLVVNLSFGKLYASIRRAVCWGFSNRMDLQLLDVSSDDSIRQRWLGLQSSFNMPTDATRVIHSLLGTQNDEDASTDKDDDNSNSNDDVVPIEETVVVALSSPAPGG